MVSRASSILLLPVYTRALSPADYGLLALLEIATEIVTIAFVAGTRSGMLRFFFDAGDEGEKRRIISTTFLTEAGRAFAGAAMLAILAPWVWRYGLDGVGTTTIVRLAALRFALGVLADTPGGLMQARGEARLSTAIVMVRLALLISFNLYFLLVLRLGVLGMVISGVIVNALVAVFSVRWLNRQVGLVFDRAISRKLRNYGAPYQITMVGAFVLTFGDRFILQKFRDATSVGLYALAYQFGFLLLELGPGPFLRAWLPERYKLLKAPAELNRHATQEGFLLLSGISVTVATAIIVGSRPVLRLLAAPAYQPAADIIPIVVVAYLFHIWNDVMKFGIDAAAQGIYYTYSSWIATGIVLGGYLLFIPKLGGIGAALATLIAFVVRFGLTQKWSQEFTPSEYGWPRVIRMSIFAASCSMVAVWLQPEELILQILLAAGLLALLLYLIWRFTLNDEEKGTVRTFVGGQARSQLQRFRGG
jgi:O-antigen/teichoic acid export membrane protein